MCGLIGIWGQANPTVAKAMLDSLIHRGPDDGFLVAGEHFALGARRLAIVDVHGGRQPLSNEMGTVWAAQNGELYNFPEMRPHLVESGHTLHTHCDTEMLPHLYEMYGADFVHHIQGMFAAAVWDDANQRGILARDRMGKKPLYYHFDGQALYFASEIKALLTIPQFEREINLEALHHFLSLKHIPCPISIFKGIFQLPPAHRLIFQPGKTPTIERYWSLDYSPIDITEDEAVDELLRLLKQGVKRRLMSDVPIGFFLSGGIDSSLTTVLATELAPEAIETFTLIYASDSTTPGKDADRHWANWVAQKYQTRHHEETIAFSHFPDSIGTILAHFDEPFAGVISTYYLAQCVSQHVKVAVTGDGADELFGSYRSHRLAFPLFYYPTDKSELLQPFGAEDLEAIYEPEDWAWRSKLLVMNDDEKRRIYSHRAMLPSYSTAQLMKDYFASLSAKDALNRILEAEFKTIFPDQVLAFADRLSMAHSLELRSPFLDTDLVEFVASLPGILKIHQGIPKYILKKAALRYFPEEMLFRPKEGFLMPITQWLLKDLQHYVREILSPQQLNKHGLFDVKAVQSMVADLYVGNKDYNYVNKVYALVIFQEWYNRYM